MNQPNPAQQATDYTDIANRAQAALGRGVHPSTAKAIIEAYESARELTAAQGVVDYNYNGDPVYASQPIEPQGAVVGEAMVYDGIDLCELAAEIERVRATEAIKEVGALAGERTDAYWAGHANACEEIQYRLTEQWKADPHGEAALPVAVGAGEELTESERAELERLRTLVNTPELHDFTSGVVLEAAHQRERWGNDHDAGKEPADWFWLLGYLAGKALKAHNDGNTDKALHHTISSAAALANWHGAILGTHNMRPGIEPPATHAGKGESP